MTYYKKHRIGHRKYKMRHKGDYVDLTKTNVNVSKKSKVAKAYDKLSEFTKKAKPKISRGAMMVKGYVQGANDGLDEAFGIPKREPDFGLMTKVPRGYKLVKKRRRR